MTTVFDVARYILNQTGAISSWKLQKLCYYAQAWSVAWTEKPLFGDRFEAWANGPVCPTLYKKHKGKFIVEPDEINGEPEKLTEDEKESIDIVIKDYGTLEPYHLREISHAEDPWKNARGGLPEGAICRNVITTEAMGMYYGNL